MTNLVTRRGTWPRYTRQSSARCFNCGAQLPAHRNATATGYGQGNGQYQCQCVRCNMTTWYDCDEPLRGAQ